MWGLRGRHQVRGAVSRASLILRQGRAKGSVGAGEASLRRCGCWQDKPELEVASEVALEGGAQARASVVIGRASPSLRQDRAKDGVGDSRTSPSWRQGRAKRWHEY